MVRHIHDVVGDDRGPCRRSAARELVGDVVHLRAQLLEVANVVIGPAAAHVVHVCLLGIRRLPGIDVDGLDDGP